MQSPTATWAKDAASFRDPAGFVFVQAGTVYRQVNEPFAIDYRCLMDCGLYQELTRRGLMVDHEEVPLRLADGPPAYAVLRPRRVPFISYPYEWSFGQLKAAALAMLQVQKIAMEYGFTLRDASAYNMQFVDGRPQLIDTLSFGSIEEGEPWVAYRQFCQHFLAPLALMACAHPSLGRLLRAHIDGIPLDVASALLPASTRLRFGLLTHIHLHGRSVARHSEIPSDGRGGVSSRRSFGRLALSALVDSLESAVRRVTHEPRRSAWTDYYGNTNYTTEGEQNKQEVVRKLLAGARRGGPLSMIWDLGANTGLYSRIAAEGGANVVAFDMDEGAVELHYRDCTARGEKKVLPLVQDLTNPSPGTGWRSAERQSLVERGPCDLALALALVHHLAIGNNVPLDEIAAFLAAITGRLIIEFVPKEDSQVARMLSVRADIFPDYTRDTFETTFERRFRIVERVPIGDSCRTLYLMERNAS